MNLRVRSVTAGAAFVSAMVDAACLAAARGVGFAGAFSRGRLEAAAAGKRAGGRGSNIYLLKP